MDMNFFSIITLGFLLGVRHATDADHVVAVTTIVSRQKKVKAASVIGAVWGIGHTLTVFLVGTAVIVGNVVIPERLALSFEFLVALALIVLGLTNLTGAWNWLIYLISGKKRVHAHLHFHDTPHVHLHTHNGHSGEPQNPSQTLRLRSGQALLSFVKKYGAMQLGRAFLVGIIHGLAGSAAIAILILTTIKNPREAVLYLLVFGVGTVTGMMAITTAIGFPLIASSKKLASFDPIATIVSGFLSLSFGLWLAYQIGVVEGLLGF